jgi:aspartate/methionine/tyrosine aminotransferase
VIGAIVGSQGYDRVEKNLLASRTSFFRGSRIVEIARLASKHRAIDLAMGSPETPVVDLLKQAAMQAIDQDVNQYANMWGAKPLREAIAEKVRNHLSIRLDPETEITVTCGATEAMLNALLVICEPGDEVILFEPFYENYLPAIRLAGAIPRFVSIRPPDWNFALSDLKRAFGARTKAVIINTPNNPTGKVFRQEELRAIADLCHRWNVVCITDEIYEHLVFDGLEHRSMIQFEDMRDRTVVISGLSKTYNLTGWRVGYLIAPAQITHLAREIHECVTAGAPAPLQAAGITAMHLPSSYYQELQRGYQSLRDRLVDLLKPLGFVCYKPQGAYYLMTDIEGFGFESAVEFVSFLIKEVGIAAVPGYTFYADPTAGKTKVRFCFGKAAATLEAAAQRLATFESALHGIVRS